MLTTDTVPPQLVAAVRRWRARGLDGAGIRAMYAEGLHEAGVPADVQGDVMRLVLRAIARTRPADEPGEWEAS